MPLNFQPSGGGSVDFGQIGITISVTGITTTITIYDTQVGVTTPTAFAVPTANYVLATGLSASINSATATTVTGGILSLTAVGSRPVNVSLFGGTAGYIEAQTLGQQITSLVRVLRGPSTVIGEAALSQFLESNISTDINSLRIPPSSFNFIDLPSAGAATYILQVNAAGTSTLISLRNVSMFVRQL